MKALFPFIKLFKKQLWWMILGMALSYATILASIGLMTLSGWFISAAAYASLSYSAASQFNFFLPAAGVRFFSLMRIANRYGERVVTHEATFKILTYIRVWFYNKLEPLAPAHLMRYRSGDLLSKIVNDIDALDNLYIRVLAPSIVVIFVAAFIGVFYSFFDAYIALFAVIAILVAAFCIPFLVGMLARKTGNSIAQVSAELKSEVVEHIQGLAELKVFVADEAHLKKLRDQNKALIRLQHKMSIYAGIGSGLMTVTLGVTLVGVVWMGVGLVSAGFLNGAIIALLGLGTMALFEAVMPIPVAYQYLGRTVSSAKRLLKVVEDEPEVIFNECDKISLEHYDIHYDQVGFSYEQGNPVLHNVSTSIVTGKKVAISGHTGSGKSTFIHLLARFWDCDSGMITIGGVKITDFSEAQLRNLMTVISQKPHIFSTTIKENLAIAKPEASEAEMMDALAQVDLKQFVLDLPDGIHTWTGENGRALSGGQQKRLALARAILRDGPILVLDEPTEGLDSITEHKVVEALEKFMRGKTVLLVTHNERLARRMDVTLNFEHGKIVSS